MKNLSWKIGDVEVFQIFELEAGPIIEYVVGKATPESIKKMPWLIPSFANKNGRLKAYVQSFLIKSGGENILIDTCNGNHKDRRDLPAWGHLRTGFLKRLFDCTGLSPKEINAVVCTHMHMDHVGWNTVLKKGLWTPTFPNATYLFPRAGYERLKHSLSGELGDNKRAFKDSIQPIVKAGLAKFVGTHYKIDANISLFSTPGHTPGHMSVFIKSKKRQAIIPGDLIHHPCQLAHPEWGIELETAPALTTKTRQKLLRRLENSNTLLIGSHFSGPVAGYVRRKDGERIFTTRA